MKHHLALPAPFPAAAIRTIALLVVFTLPLPATLSAAEWRSIAHGGEGGEPFEVVCPQYTYLAGLRARIGNDMDAVGIFCQRFGADGAIGSGLQVGELYGGPGGVGKGARCGENTPIVRGMEVRSEGVTLTIVDGVVLTCGPLTGAVPTPVPGYSLFELHGDFADPNPGVRIFTGSNAGPTTYSLACPPDMAPVGIHGGAGLYVDRLGLVCRDIEVEPPPAPPPPTLQPDRPMIGTGNIERARAMSRPDLTDASVPAGAAADRVAPAAASGGSIATVPLQPGGPAFDRIAEVRPNELLCRGGGSYPSGRYGQVPGKPDREWHVLFVVSSETPTGPDGSGLEPGRCGFPAGGERISHVVLETSPNDGTVQQILAQLADAGSYYRFLLRHNAERGWQDVIEHRAWTPPASAAAAPSAVGTAAALPIQGAAAPSAAVATARNLAGDLPPNLFTLDDSALIVVGGASTPAGEVKRTVRTQLERLPEPTRTFALCAVGAEPCRNGGR